ncbi:hypothetical protein VF21_10627 [Pseudogymnoascus sp. 05NY08]|nr:hypothetical protein VF21_10627 [Pseudogymnoascus sp. 05NY08]
MVGLALRVAQGIGLHVDQSAHLNETRQQREIRRRVWYTCVMMDRLTATTFGRPTLLSRNWSVPRPLAIDDEFSSDTGSVVQPAGVPSQFDCFVYSIDFFDILSDVLDVFYTPTNEHNQRLDVAFAAATIIVAATIIPESGSDMTYNSADGVWEKALEIFHYNDLQSHSVHRGLEALKAFRSQVLTVRLPDTTNTPEFIDKASTRQEFTTASTDAVPTAFDIFNTSNIDNFEDSWFLSQVTNFDEWYNDPLIPFHETRDDTT